MYGKAFASMYTGSLMGSGPLTFAVWGYVIANAEPPGVVELNSKLISAILGCTVGEVEATIEKLCSPDPDSRSKEHEGRRLLKCGSFLYEIPSWAKYQAIKNAESRRAQNAEAQRKYRAKRLLEEGEKF